MVKLLSVHLFIWKSSVPVILMCNYSFPQLLMSIVSIVDSWRQQQCAADAFRDARVFYEKASTQYVHSILCIHSFVHYYTYVQSFFSLVILLMGSVCISF